jgi:transposase
LLPPSYVRPYVQRSKTDRADVKGILETWRNSDIRPVPVKTESQQQLTCLHRIRSAQMATRTMRINSDRGLLREFGIDSENASSQRLSCVQASGEQVSSTAGRD